MHDSWVIPCATGAGGSYLGPHLYALRLRHRETDADGVAAAAAGVCVAAQASRVGVRKYTDDRDLRLAKSATILLPAYSRVRRTVNIQLAFPASLERAIGTAAVAKRRHHGSQGQGATGPLCEERSLPTTTLTMHPPSERHTTTHTLLSSLLSTMFNDKKNTHIRWRPTYRKVLGHVIGNLAQTAPDSHAPRRQ